MLWSTASGDELCPRFPNSQSQLSLLGLSCCPQLSQCTVIRYTICPTREVDVAAIIQEKLKIKHCFLVGQRAFLWVDAQVFYQIVNFGVCMVNCDNNEPKVNVNSLSSHILLLSFRHVLRDIYPLMIKSSILFINGGTYWTYIRVTFYGVYANSELFRFSLLHKLLFSRPRMIFWHFAEGL